tara:strand:- start:5337 stop:5528 length:192 start_codon:yes stop_codon:yes gene_type:complete
MVGQNEAQEFGLTTEDINAAFQANPTAGMTAQINMLQRVIATRDSRIAELEAEIEELKGSKKK